MLAPIDKLNRKGGNRIIQIEVTRKCDLFACSNCTRLLPFRHDAIEMSLDVFRRAVESLRDWPGVVAVFGGNPCTHSRFPDLCAIIAEIIPPQRRGLWTNNVRQHGEIAARTFGRGVLNLNAHADTAAADEMERWFPGRVIKTSRDRASWHSPILVDRRDVGMSDGDWLAAREKCSINQDWSAIIMQVDDEPQAFFCEVAGAISAVRGERHGVPVEPGWWRWTMDRFAHQVRECCDRGCGVPLSGLGHLDRDDTYDLSPSWVPLTIERKPRVKSYVHTTMPSKTECPTDYQAHRTHKPAPEPPEPPEASA